MSISIWCRRSAEGTKVLFQYLSSMLLCYIKTPLKHDVHSFLDVESLKFATFTPCLAHGTRIQHCHLPTWGWGIRPRFPVVQANLTHRFFCQKIKSSTCQPTQMTLQTHSGSGSNNVISDSTSGQWLFSGHHGQKIWSVVKDYWLDLREPYWNCVVLAKGFQRNHSKLRNLVLPMSYRHQ